MRTLHAVVIALLISPLAIEAGAAEPSFDCTKASGEAEEAICASETLASLDRTMAETYRAARDSLAGAADAKAATDLLTTTQRGWIKGRNECWKSSDKVRCTHDSYDMRIAELQARYFLIEAAPPVFYECENNPSNEIVASFVATDLPSVRLERGDTVKVGLLVQTGSGSKYIADHGTSFWIKGDEAQVSWPEGNDFKCQVRKDE